jgi:hypothetical protein
VPPSKGSSRGTTNDVSYTVHCTCKQHRHDQGCGSSNKLTCHLIQFFECGTWKGHWGNRIQTFSAFLFLCCVSVSKFIIIENKNCLFLYSRWKCVFYCTVYRIVFLSSWFSCTFKLLKRNGEITSIPTTGLMELCILLQIAVVYEFFRLLFKCYCFYTCVYVLFHNYVQLTHSLRWK